MFRLRNDVDDVVRELLKITCELQEPGRLPPAAGQIKFPCCCQAVRSVEAPTGLCHDTLLVLIAMRCTWIGRVCAGGGSFSKSFAGTTICAFGRSPSACWSSRCTRVARARPSGFTGSACTWLTVPHAHDSAPDLRQAAGTLNVETNPWAAQESWTGPRTACSDSLACRPSRAHTCQALPCGTRMRVPAEVVWSRLCRFLQQATDFSGGWLALF